MVIIATAGYPPFAVNLIASARKHFAPGHRRQFLVLTDRPAEFATQEAGGDIAIRHVTHAPWPAMTLRRYHFMLEHAAFLDAFDCIYYCDADCLFEGNVDFHSLGALTAVIHAGYQGKPRRMLPYEDRSSSAAYIARNEGVCYYCGGFQGGGVREYLEAAECIAGAIDRDERLGITAKWHDESHWNRYLLDHPPAVVLPPHYCWPEEWHPHGDARLIALKKDHQAVRQLG